MIVHNPVFDVDVVTKHYSEKDGVPVKYVCTTELKLNNSPVDIYYRETPHPEFRNHYFGLRLSHDGTAYICNADSIDGETIAMIEDSKGDLHYSSYRHDYKVVDNGNMIDGGRSYVKTNTLVKCFSIKNGQLINSSNDKRC